MKPVVTVLSSFARDILISEKTGEKSRRSGGPAFFIKKVFDKEKIAYDLKTGKLIEVEILLSGAREVGRIKSPVKKQPMPATATDILFISTILDEWPISAENFKGKLFLDIQGFVRNGRLFGGKKKLKIPRNFKPFCVKGTQTEIGYLPESFINAQKRRCLIKTLGGNGSEIFIKGKKYFFRPERLVNSPETIGAGDTFFSNFIAHFIKTGALVESGEFATKKTVDFLSKKIDFAKMRR